MQAPRLCQLSGVFYRSIEVPAVNNQFATQGSHGPVLILTVAFGHYDNCPHIVQSCRQGNTLPVISTGSRYQTLAVRLALAQAMQVNQPTAHLERSSEVMVFMFYPDLAATTLAEQGPVDLWSGLQLLIDNLRGSFQI